MLEKCVLTILELNWNQRLGHKKTKLNICHHMLTSSTQLQNRSSDVVERTRTSSKCQKLKNARAKRAKILFFIVKYANLSGLCCRRRRGCLSYVKSAFTDPAISITLQRYFVNKRTRRNSFFLFNDDLPDQRFFGWAVLWNHLTFINNTGHTHKYVNTCSWGAVTRNILRSRKLAVNVTLQLWAPVEFSFLF